jgi:hypothetical protein
MIAERDLELGQEVTAGKEVVVEEDDHIHARGAGVVQDQVALHAEPASSADDPHREGQGGDRVQIHILQRRRADDDGVGGPDLPLQFQQGLGQHLSPAGRGDAHGDARASRRRKR